MEAERAMEYVSPASIVPRAEGAREMNCEIAGVIHREQLDKSWLLVSDIVTVVLAPGDRFNSSDFCAQEMFVDPALTGAARHTKTNINNNRLTDATKRLNAWPWFSA